MSSARRPSNPRSKSMSQPGINTTPRGTPSTTQAAGGALNVNLLFEPTGHLEKDYCAYCEISDKNERDDVLDGIYREELEAVPTAASLAAYTTYAQNMADSTTTTGQQQIGSSRTITTGRSTSNANDGTIPLSARDTIGTMSTTQEDGSPGEDSRLSSAAPSRPKSATVGDDGVLQDRSISTHQQPAFSLPAHPPITRTLLFLRNLSFSLNKRDMQPLTDALPHCTTLSSVRLTGCGVSEYSYKLLVAAVYRSSSVHTLAVDMNPDGFYNDCTVNPKRDKNEISVYLSEFRGAHLKINQIADMDERAMGAGGGLDRGGADSAAKKVAAKPAKTTSGTGGSANKKVAAQAAQLAEASDMAEKFVIPVPTGWHSALMTGVQVLSLRGNGITDAQMGPLCDLLSNNTDLLSLSLWGNKITDVGAKMVAEALKSNRKLVALNLGHNDIGDEGMIAIAGVFLTETVSYTEMLARRSRALSICPTSGMNQLRTADQHPILLQQHQLISEGASSANATTTLNSHNIPILVTPAAPAPGASPIAVAVPPPPLTQLFPTFADVAAAGISKMVEDAPISKLKDLGVAVQEIGGSMKSGAQGVKAARGGAGAAVEKPNRRNEKAGQLEAPIERPTIAFDSDVIRLHEDPEENPAAAQLISQQINVLHSSSSANQQTAALQTIIQASRYRVPSNTTLVSVNMAHNTQITSDGVRRVTTMLERGEPNAETLYGLLSLATVQSSAGGTGGGYGGGGGGGGSPASSPTGGRGKSIASPSGGRKSVAAASPGKSADMFGTGLAMNVAAALTSVSGPSGMSAPASNGPVICQQLTTAVLSSPLAFVLNEVRQYVPTGCFLKKFEVESSRIDLHVLDQLNTVVSERYRAAHFVEDENGDENGGVRSGRNGSNEYNNQDSPR